MTASFYAGRKDYWNASDPPINVIEGSKTWFFQKVALLKGRHEASLRLVTWRHLKNAFVSWEKFISISGYLVATPVMFTIIKSKMEVGRKCIFISLEAPLWRQFVHQKEFYLKKTKNWRWFPGAFFYCLQGIHSQPKMFCAPIESSIIHHI